MSDLVRAMDLDLDVEFMVVSSYGSSTQSSGNIKINLDLKADLTGKHVLIVEDILDTGRTLYNIRDIIRLRGPESVKICTLLDKPARRKTDIKADFVGFTVEDKFIIGYGLDYAEKYRNLPYIGVLRPEIYQ
jgi:hypoxanthine phosphoribosyltransferase